MVKTSLSNAVGTSLIPGWEKPRSCVPRSMTKILKRESHVYYHVRNKSPVYVRYRIQDAWGWYTGMIQRDNMGWEVGEGFMFGNACTPVVDSCQCREKPIQYCKVK